MAKSMNRILITGGAGFIGSNLAKKLSEKGYEVVVLDNLSKQIHGHNPEIDSPLFISIMSNEKVKFIKGSVSCKRDWEIALDGVDAIFHLAAETGTGQSMYEIKKYVDVNINGTAIMLDLLSNTQHKVKKIVLSSSRSIYGEGRYECPIHGEIYPNQRKEYDMNRGDFECKCPHCNSELVLMATNETSKIHPSSLYGITKQNQEQMVMLLGKSIGIDVVSLRYQNVYGPGQSLKNPYTGILSIFSTQIKNDNNINIFEDGLESRDFVFIDDVINATILGLERDEAVNRSINVGSGNPVTVLTVANTLRKNFNSKIKLDCQGNYRVGDIRHNYADISLAYEVLGYKPKVSFDIGIERFCSWVNTQDVQQDRYAKSINEMKKKGLYK